MDTLFTLLNGIQSYTIAKSTLPIDTGNLRFNATKFTRGSNYFKIYIDGDVAPYFEHLDGTGHSQQYKGDFETLTFTPVFNYLKDSLKGRFASGRNLSKLRVSYEYEALLKDRITREMNLTRRQEVFEKYTSGGG